MTLAYLFMINILLLYMTSYPPYPSPAPANYPPLIPVDKIPPSNSSGETGVSVQPSHLSSSSVLVPPNTGTTMLYGGASRRRRRSKKNRSRRNRKSRSRSNKNKI
jgi:hypothetical protein